LNYEKRILPTPSVRKNADIHPGILPTPSVRKNADIHPSKVGNIIMANIKFEI